MRVEVAAFEETAGVDIMLKCSGFIDLAVYYEDYLAAHNGEQGEDGMEEQYKKLIQSQHGEMDEHRVEEPYEDLTQAHEDDLEEDDVKAAIDQEKDETSVLVPDPTDDLNL